jgi:hypothetical protein
MREERKAELLRVGVEALGASAVSEHGRPNLASWFGIQVDFVFTDDDEAWADWKAKHEKQLVAIVTSLVSNGFFVIERIEVQDNFVLLHRPGFTNIYKLGAYQELEEG